MISTNTKFTASCINTEKQSLLNTYVNNIDMSEALYIIEQMIAYKQKSYLVAVNVDVIMKIEQDNYLKKITDKADMVFVDGKPLIWISKLYSKPVKSKISGSDLVPELCRIATVKGYRIFIIGGKDGVATHAKENLERKFPEIKIVGTYAPPIGFEKDREELEYINAIISEVKPHILIGCFGCPKQEKWIYENYKNYDSIVSICAGATVDFLSGNIRRAPQWMRNYGLEWFYRFLQEPKRMFRRYFVEDIRIIGLIWKYKESFKHPKREE